MTSQYQDVLSETINALSDFPNADTVMTTDFELYTFNEGKLEAGVDFLKYSDAEYFCRTKCKPENVWRRPEALLVQTPESLHGLKKVPATAIKGRYSDKMYAGGFGYCIDSKVIDLEPDDETFKAGLNMTVHYLLETLQDIIDRLSHMPEADISNVYQDLDIQVSDNPQMVIHFNRWKEAEEFLKMENPDFKEFTTFNFFYYPDGWRRIVYGAVDDRILAVTTIPDTAMNDKEDNHDIR